MKFKKIMPAVIAGTIVLSGATPFGVEAFAGTVEDANYVSTESITESAETIYTTVKNVETEKEKKEKKQKIVNETIDDFVKEARKEIKEEKIKKSNADVEAYEYIFIDDTNELMYTYQEVENTEYISVEDVTFNKDNSNNKESRAAANLPSGIGGRQVINVSGVNSVTGQFGPTIGTTITSANTTAYLYMGFSGGSTETDMGLQYSTKYGGWKPYVKRADLGILTNTGSYYETGYNQVTEANYYVDGFNINYTAYPNYNNQLRFELVGQARYANIYGTGNSTNLKTIVRGGTPITNTTRVKLLATLAVLTAGEEAGIRGKLTGNINNTKINDYYPSSSAWATPEEDYATITRNGNYVNFVVSK